MRVFVLEYMFVHVCMFVCVCVCVHVRVCVSCVCMCLRDTFHLIERGVLNSCYNVTAIFITPCIIVVMNALLCSTNTTIKVLLQCTFTLVGM